MLQKIISKTIFLFRLHDPNSTREQLWEVGIWVNKEEEREPVKDMTLRRVNGILEFLQKRAQRYHAYMVHFYIHTPEPQGEMAQDAFDQEFQFWCKTDWQELFEDYSIVPFLLERKEKLLKEMEDDFLL